MTTNNYITLPLVNAGQLNGTVINTSSLGAAQDGYVLTYVNSVPDLEFKPGGSSSSVTLSGAVTGPNTATLISLTSNASITGTLPTANQVSQALGGDLSGTTAGGTVVKLQGNSVKSGTNGASQDGYVLSWVNANSDYELVKYAGDVTGSPNANTVISLTGSSGKLNIASTGNIITWAAATTAPGLAQTAAVSGAGANMTIAPQAATTTGASGNLIAGLSIPASGTVEAYFRVNRGASTVAALGVQPSDTYGSLFLGNAVTTPSTTNYTLWGFGGNTYIGAGGGNVYFRPSGAAGIGVVTGNGFQFGSETTAFGGGAKVLGITNATTNPSTNPAGGVVLYSELTTGNLKNRGSLGSITTVAVPGSNLTINSQKQIIDGYIGTCETVSSATPTVIMNYPTVSGTGGLLTLSVVSRATTTAGGVTAGDTATNRYVLAYKNVSGTITLSTAGIVVDGTAPAQTTNATLTAPVLTTAIVGNVIQFLVTNAAVDTVDSQCYLTANVC